MNKIAASFVAFGLALGLSLTSCSDEPEVSLDALSYVKKGDLKDGKINPAFFNDIISGKTDATFKITDRSYFYCDDLTNDKWEQKSGDWAGGGIYTPSTFIISGGKVLRDVGPSRSLGRRSFYRAVDLLNSLTDNNYKPQIGIPVSYDSDTRTLITAYGHFYVLAAGKNTLSLSCMIPYEGGRTQNGGIELQVGCYNVEWSCDLDENTLEFSSDEKAFDWIIDQYDKNLVDQLPSDPYDLVYCFMRPDWEDPRSVAGYLIYYRDNYVIKGIW